MDFVDTRTLANVRKYHALVMISFGFRRPGPICNGYGRQGHHRDVSCS